MNVQAMDHETLRTVVRRRGAGAWLWKQRWFLACVGLPTLIAAVYYGLIASDVYVSETRFVIKSPGQKSAQSLTLANIVQTSGLGGGQEQTKEILDYIRSRDALTDLQRAINIKAMYAEREADFLSGFPRPLREDSFENLYRYYQSRMSADVDSNSGMAVVSAEAFTPQDARRINERLLLQSEALVNRLNSRAESRAITEAQSRVAAAESRFRNARVELSAYRNEQGLLDPVKQATGVLEVSNALVGEQAALIAQLDLMRRVTPRHPAIPALQQRIVAIGREVGAQTGRAVGAPGAIASKLANYEKLAAEQEFATLMLTAANTALEQARTEAQKQQFYLERVVEPNTPDMAQLPSRLKRILVIFAAAICLYFIAWMLVVGILEHAPED